MSETMIRQLKLNAVVAMCNSNNGIGLNGTLPWKIPNDLKFFGQVTKFTKDKSKKNAVIIGRKTWFSLPNAFRPLPNRINIIVSNTIKSKDQLEANPKSNLDDIHICESFDSAIQLCNNKLSSIVESIHVIGGAQIYEDAFNYKYFDRLYLTRVLKDFECDTFIKPKNFLDSFTRIENENIDVNSQDENVKGFEINKIQTENGIEYIFEIYKRKF